MRSYVTTTHTATGWKALLVRYDLKTREWEPYQTGIGAYAHKEDAEAEAIDWACAEGLRYERGGGT